MKSFRAIFPAAVAAVLFAAAPGCMWSRVVVNDPSIVGRSRTIKEGVTKEAELEAILSARPTMRMPVGGADLLAYSFSDTKHNGLMLIAFNFTRSTTVAETLYVEIDRATGTVKKVHRPEVPEVSWRFWPFGQR
jgi:hypothetical protein